MTDYDSIWRTQDEIRTVVNAVECIWNLSYQFSITADYEGEGAKCFRYNI